jgi:hypothetical protein
VTLAEVHPRSAWQTPSSPVTGPRSAPPLWEAVVYHYPGSTAKPPLTLAGLYALCRSMQASYLRDPRRGYSLGYCFVIGAQGEIVEARGLDIRNAANNGVPRLSGYANYNPITVSVQFVVQNGQPATAAQLAAASRLHVDIERLIGRKLRVEGHGDKDSTPCPGDGIRGQLPVLAKLIDEVRNPPPTSTPIPAYKIRKGETMVTGLWMGPNDPGVYAVCSNRTKVWCFPETVDEHQALLRIEGTDDTVRVQTSASLFRAMGPVIGPRPAGVDEYGWKD